MLYGYDWKIKIYLKTIFGCRLSFLKQKLMLKFNSPLTLIKALIIKLLRLNGMQNFDYLLTKYPKLRQAKKFVDNLLFTLNCSNLWKYQIYVKVQIRNIDCLLKWFSFIIQWKCNKTNSTVKNLICKYGTVHRWDEGHIFIYPCRTIEAWLRKKAFQEKQKTN